MPNVIATPRGQNNGQVLTEFIDSVGTSSVTYTYPKTQEWLTVRNIGTKSITVTVGGTSQALQPGQRWDNTADFTAFSIVSSSGVQAFEATADEKGSVFSSPEGRYFAALFASGTVPVSDTTAPIVSVSIPTGTYNSTQSVTLTSNETATIYYTLDGSTPTISSTVYSAAISISSTTTLKYFGKDTAGNSSAVQTVTYSITNSRLVGSRAAYPYSPTASASGFGSSTVVTFETVHVIEQATNKLKLMYGWNPDTAFAGTIKASINGVAFTFSAQPSVVLNANQTATTDEITGTFTQNQQVKIRTTVTVASTGLTVPSSIDSCDSAIGDAISYSDVPVGTPITSATQFFNAYAPYAIIGQVSDASVESWIAFGDSILDGYLMAPSTNSLMYGARGYVEKGFGKRNVGFINQGIGGETAITDFALPLNAFRLQTLNLGIANKILIQYGRNDITQGKPIGTLKTQIKALIAEVKTRAPNAQVYLTTVTPSPIDATTKAANDSVRVDYNEWVRAGADGTIAGYFDAADYGETSRNSGLWKTGYNFDAGDRVHLSESGSDAVSAVMLTVTTPTADTTAPPVPTGLSGIGYTQQAQLNWSAVADSGLAGYNIYRNGTKVVSLVTGTSYTDTGLTNGTSYSYEVTAVDYANNESAKSTAVSVTPNVPVGANDTFTRANAAVLGNAESGQPWELIIGLWKIQANQAKANDINTNLIVIESSLSNGSVSSNMTVTDNAGMLVSRFSDINNYLYAELTPSGSLTLKKKVAGANTTLGSATVTYLADTPVKIVMAGSSVSVQYNGTEVIPAVTETFNQNATKHGLASWYDTCAHDNFAVA